MVEYFINKNNISIEEYFLKENPQLLENMSFREKIFNVMKNRLFYLNPFISTWPQALALLSLPQNLNLSLRLFGETIDQIVHISGDKSVDLDWYFKRFTLGDRKSVV